MWILATGLLVLTAGAMGSWLWRALPRVASAWGACSAIVGSALVLTTGVQVLSTGQVVALELPWSVPFGEFSLQVDALSAVFLLPISIVVAVAAVYGVSYVHSSLVDSAVGRSWLFFNLLAVSMLVVVTARNGLLFLVGWEGMSLSSFFLVLTHYEQESSRRASWIYLAAMHLGTAFVVVLFLVLGRSSGSLDFDRFLCPSGWSGILFVLAVVGFGTKAGFIPVHVWLPEAHPAAPSHVSAVMSGVMIKTGIYGLLRTLTFLDAAPPWWGWTLVAVGVVSGVLGVLFALAQHDLKRLLAYHSVENIGIIAMGLGVGLLGVAYGLPGMAFLGLAGALLHVLNHALFKSLLFLGAGAVQHATGTRDLDRLGGLLKTMPVTGTTFLVASCAISGLPPLNGFVSELLIYLGVFSGQVEANRPGGGWWVLLCVLVVGGLALIGGLAAACFTKAFGCVFLGEARGGPTARGHEVNGAMRGAMIFLAGACFLVALTGPAWPWVYRSAIEIVLATPVTTLHPGFVQARQVLAVVCAASWLLVAGIAGLAWWRVRLLSGRRIERAPTWDCGYAAPTARMQYTASSFASPLLQLFRLVLRPHAKLDAPDGLFPQTAHFESHTADVFEKHLYQPIFVAVTWSASQLRWLQNGRLQLYVLYIALTILVLLIWKLG